VVADLACGVWCVARPVVGEAAAPGNGKGVAPRNPQSPETQPGAGRDGPRPGEADAAWGAYWAGESNAFQFSTAVIVPTTLFTHTGPL
jgi:hypothetical protein